MNGRRSFAGLILLGLSFGAAPVRAELKWSEIAQNLVADPGKREAAATFSFVNTGKTAVQIVDLVPSCGCTKATLEKRSYAPGEVGRIEVVIRYDAAASRVQQTVIVITDEPKHERQLLTVDVTVPGKPRTLERIEVSPQSLEWGRGAGSGSKVVSLRITQVNDAIRPVSAADETGAFTVLLQHPEPSDPRAYELVVTPRRPDRPAQAIIVIRTNARTFRPDWLPDITYQVTATVK